MSERPKFETRYPSSFENKERERFWDGEIEAWQERQLDKSRKDSMTRDQIIRDIYNNLPGWLPFEYPGSFVGAHRDEDGFMYFKNDENVDRVSLGERICRDVDEYVKKNDLEKMVHAIAFQNMGQRMAIEQAFAKGTNMKDVTWAKTLTDAEIQEFMEDLYQYLRSKGYTRAEIAT